MRNFHERLTHLLELRIRQGALKSQSDLARLLGIGQRRLLHYKNRSEPDYELLSRLCEALQTHPNYLLGWSNEIEPRYTASVSKLNGLEQEVADLRRTLRAFISKANP